MYYKKSNGANLDGALSTIKVNGSEYQIGKDATNENAGIAKLYDAVSDGVTDGAVTPNAVYDAIAALSGDTETNLGTIESKLNTLIGEDASKSARTIANEELAAQLIPANAQESLDTLQEIAAWIQQHPEDAAAMNTAINNRKVLQTAVADADATTSGNAIVFVDSVTQNENGDITVHKKNITVADGSNNGLMSSSDYTKLQNLPANSTLTTSLDAKSDKVSNATAGNFAGLDANGNLTDSGSKAADFATAAQGAKADTAIQGISINGTPITISNAQIADLGDYYVQDASYVHTDNNFTTAEKNKLAAISASVNGDTLELVSEAA